MKSIHEIRELLKEGKLEIPNKMNSEEARRLIEYIEQIEISVRAYKAIDQIVVALLRDMGEDEVGETLERLWDLREVI